jgi:hypothetical protein
VGERGGGGVGPSEKEKEIRQGKCANDICKKEKINSEKGSYFLK